MQQYIGFCIHRLSSYLRSTAWLCDGHKSRCQIALMIYLSSLSRSIPSLFIWVRLDTIRSDVVNFKLITRVGELLNVVFYLTPLCLPVMTVMTDPTWEVVQRYHSIAFILTRPIIFGLIGAYGHLWRDFEHMFKKHFSAWICNWTWW